MDGRRDMKQVTTNSRRSMRMVFAAHCCHVLLALLAVLFCLSAAGARAANVDSCGASLQSGTIPRLDTDKARQVQEALITIYRNDPLFPRGNDADRALLADGKIGPVTKAWLWRFCRDFSVTTADAETQSIVNAVLNFSAIITDHPEWQAPLMSPALTRCIDARPRPDREKDLTNRLYGSDEDIAALLRKCRDERPAPDAKAVFRSDATAVYYKLTAADLVQLAGPDKVLAAIEKIQANPPGDDKAFESEVTKALEEAKLPVKQYLPIVQRHARYFQLTADSIRKLRAKGLPPAVVEIASSQQDLPFLNREKLAAALAAAAGEQSEKLAMQRMLEDTAEATKTANERASEAKAAADKSIAAKGQAKQTQDNKLAAARSASEKATDARLAAEVAEADKSAAEKNLATKAAALAAATEAAAAAKTAARVAEEERVAAEKVLAGRLPFFRGAAQKAVNEKTAAAKAAADKITQTQAAVKEATSAKAAAQETLAAKATLAKAAAEKAEAAKSATKQAFGDKSAADDAADVKTAAAKSAAMRAEAATDAAKQAALAKSTAEKSAAQEAVARRLPPFLAALEKARLEKAAAAQTAAQKAADANAAAVSAGAEKSAADSSLEKWTAAANAAALKAAEAKTAAEQAAAMKAAAEKHALAQATALAAARRRIEEAEEAAKKAQGEKVAAEAAAERKLPFFGRAAAKSAAEKAATAKAAVAELDAAKAAGKEAAKAKEAADDAVTARTAEARSAGEKAADAKAVAEGAAAAKAKAEKSVAAKATAVKEAAAQATAAMAAAGKAADELAAAEKSAADQVGTWKAQALPTQPAAAQQVESQPPLPPILAPFLSEILEVATTTRGYLLTPTLINDLRTDPEFGAVPAFVTEALKTLEGVDYPSHFLFLQAVKARIVDAFSRQVNPKETRRVVLSPDEVLPLNLPQNFLEVYKAVRTAHAAGQSADKDVAADVKWREDMRDKLLPLISPFMAAIETAARESVPWKMEKPFNWKSDGCDCVAEKLPGAIGSELPGVTYGLFPFWQWQSEQAVDFRTLLAAGFFALPFNDKGVLSDPIDGKADKKRYDFVKFVNVAREHGTRIDWVIQRLDWRTWQKPAIGEMTAMFNNLVTNIDGMLREPASGWLNEQLHRMSMGAIPRLRRGDGVTLYFENYPKDPVAVADFKAFYDKLNDTLLQSVGRDYAVNLLFPRTALGSGIFECGKLMELLHRKDGGVHTINNIFLVLIEEPTTDSKKELRQYVENCLHGKERRELLRRVVPVVAYDGRSYSQLTDDVVYADQNFRGIGFWSYPGGGGTADDQKKDEEESSKASGRDIAPLLFKQVDADHPFCGVVCTLRWWGRGLLLILSTLLLVSLLLGTWNCRFGASPGGHSRFANYILGVFFLTLLLFGALFLCDPGFAAIRAGNARFFVAMAVIIGIGVWLRQREIRKSRLP